MRRWCGGQLLSLFLAGLLTIWIGIYLLGRRFVGDAIWDLRTGQWEWAHHAVLRVNLWSWPLYGRPWINLEWGYDAVLAGLWHLGPWLVVLAVMGFGFAFAWGLAVLARDVGVPWRWVPVVVALGSLASAQWWSFRPQVLVYPLIIWWVVSAWRVRSRGTGWVYVAWALELVAVQVEGSWLLCIVFAAVELVFAVRRRDNWLLFLGSVVIPWANPWGVRGYYHAIWLSFNPNISNGISEWLAPNLRQWSNEITLWPVLIAVVFLLVYLRPRLRWRSLVYVGGCVGGLLYGWRFEFLGGLGFAALFDMVEWSGVRPVFSCPKWLRAVAMATVVWVGVFALVPVVGAMSVPASGMGWLSPGLEPVRSLEWLAVHARYERVWSYEYWSTGLVWIHKRDWIDGRADFFLMYDDQFQLYEAVIDGSVWAPAMVAATGAQYALVPVVSSLAVEMRAVGWPVVERSGYAEVVRVVSPLAERGDATGTHG